MSRFSRIVIGVATLLCAILFFMVALNPDEPFRSYGSAILLTVLCATTAVACFFPQTHSITLRIIGAAIFIFIVVGLVDRFFQAIIAFVVFGLPAGYLAIAGKYPPWGFGAEAFNSKQNDKRK